MKRSEAKAVKAQVVATLLALAMEDIKLSAGLATAEEVTENNRQVGARLQDFIDAMVTEED